LTKENSRELQLISEKIRWSKLKLGAVGEEVVELYKQDWSVKRIAKAYRVSASAVIRLLKVKGVKLRRARPPLKPIPQQLGGDEEFWAWLAGFFDGEGSLSFIQGMKDKRPRPQITITNTAIDILEHVTQTVGIGHLRKNPRYRKNHKPCQSFTLQSYGECIAFLKKIIPYLRVRKQEAINFLERCIHYREEALSERLT